MVSLHCVFCCVWSSGVSIQTVCHTAYTHTALACHHVNAQCDHCYQLQSLLHTNFHLYKMHNVRFYYRQDAHWKYPIFRKTGQSKFRYCALV